MKLSKENYSGDIHKKIIVSAENGRLQRIHPGNMK